MATAAAAPTLSDTSLPEPQPGVAELDCVPDRILIVSDLHLGVGTERGTGRYRPGENFLADHAFRGFLQSYARDLGSGPVVLVLNGDTFDFLRVDAVPELDADFADWQGSLRELGVERPIEELKRLHRREEAYGLRTEDYKCVWKLDRIAEGHPEFFQALGWWVQQGGWIVLVKGNHDVELFWPLVQLAIRREISRGAAAGRVAAQVHFAQAAVRIGNVYIEHGHQFESTTAVKGDPVLPDEPTQLNLPLGSFVNRYIINSLERLEPFLDNIKPVDRALNAVLRRHPLQVFRILWRSLPFLRRAARRYWLREWLAFAIYFASLLLPILTIAAIVAAFIWPDVVRRIPEALRPVLSVLGLIAPFVGGVLRDLMLRKRPHVGEDAYAEGLYERLARVSFEATHDVLYGVLGHTHRPDIQELPPLFGARILYLNTGTWIALWQDERPDLIGRVIYSVVSLVRGANGSYAHEYLEWRPDAGRLASAVVLGPRGRPRPGGFLDRRELATVRAFADVFIEGKEEILTPDEVAACVDAHLARVRSKRTTSLRLALMLVEYLIPLLDGRWRFSRQPAAVRRRMIDRRLARDRGGMLFRNIAKIRALFSIGYYGCERVYPSIGFVPVQERPRNRPPNPPLGPIDRPPLRLTAPPHGQHTIDADLCVVGSGAGGAVIAAHAATAGLSVVLLDEGRYFPTSVLSHREPVMSAMLYKESGLQSTVDLGMTILQGRALGGTTTINNHICFRIGDPLLTQGLPDPIEHWREELRVNIDRARLAESYARVTAAIRAEPIGDDIVGSNGFTLLRGWEALLDQGAGDRRFGSGRFTKNYNPEPGKRCGGCGYCNFGCPYGRKLSMLETYVTSAYEHGARILTECHAERLVRRGRRVAAVECRLADGRELVVRADRTVVAGGAIGSTVLLLRSGYRGRAVGSRFSFNTATPVFAHFPQAIDAYDGIQMATFVDAGDVLIESSFNPPMAFAVALPGWFATHFDRMRDFTHFASAGVVIATSPSGRVKRSSLTRTLFGPVAWRMDGAEFARLQRGMSLLAQIYFAAGADYVLPATIADHPMDAARFAPDRRPDAGAIDHFLRTTLVSPDMVTLNSSHPQGGNPMSDDPSIGVVDSGFRVHGSDNLYVADASVFPTSIRINPQLTIMALADYAWHTSIKSGGAR